MNSRQIEWMGPYSLGLAAGTAIIVSTGRVGVYRIQIPAKLPRAGGVDPDGVLYIGEGDLVTRLVMFDHSARTGKNGHPAGQMYFDGKVNTMYPYHKLTYSLAVMESKEEAEMLESRLLIEYFKRWMEVPPLNSTMEWKAWGKELDE